MDELQGPSVPNDPSQMSGTLPGSPVTGTLPTIASGNDDDFSAWLRNPDQTVGLWGMPASQESRTSVQITLDPED